MQFIPTGREDIEVIGDNKITPERPIRLSLAGGNGGTTDKALSAGEALALATALLQAARLETSGSFTISV
jgi:hypothetical protein